MRITIGEIANELLPYSNLIEFNVTNGVPFIRALIGSESGIAKVYMYIVQLDENLYSACNDHDDTCGSRMFPTGNSRKPFVRELDIIHSRFGGSSTTVESGYYSSINKVDRLGFMNYFDECLIKNDIIRFDPKNYDTKLVDMYFNSPRIRRQIEKSFADNKARQGTVRDLINIVNRCKYTFDLSGIKSKDMLYVISKLKDIGLNVSLKEGYITSITFDRRP